MLYCDDSVFCKFFAAKSERLIHILLSFPSTNKGIIDGTHMVVIAYGQKLHFIQSSNLMKCYKQSDLIFFHLHHFKRLNVG